MALPRISARALVQPARTFATAASASEVRVKNPLIELKPAIREKAEQLSSNWKGTSASGGNTRNYIGGEFVESKADKWVDVVDPVSPRNYSVEVNSLKKTQSTQTLLTKVPETTSSEFEQAVDAASQAFKSWSRMSVLTRQRFAME